MPPRRLATSSNAGYGSGTSYSLANTKESFRDLLIFEERLKQNSTKLTRQRRKYEVFLVVLVGSSLLLTYRVFVVPSSSNTLLQVSESGGLLICIVTLILFFATGVYSEKIAYAHKFVPQANRALRYYNIYLNTKRPPRSWSLNSWRIWSIQPSARTSSSTNLARVSSQTSFGLSRTTSSSSRHGGMRSRSPLSPRSQSVPLAPIPPASNPRGEIIFSSKVSNAYKEGYERYRAEFERRRKPSKHELGWMKYLLSFGRRRPKRVTNSSTVPQNVSEKPTRAVSPMHEPANVNQNSSTPLFPEFSDSSTSSTPQLMPLQTPTLPSLPSIQHALGRPSSMTEERGRDHNQRPLLRSGSSSSVSSLGLSPSPSRKSSPLRNAMKRHATGDGNHSGTSTPDLILEEDESGTASQRLSTESLRSRLSGSPQSTARCQGDPANSDKQSPVSSSNDSDAEGDAQLAINMPRVRQREPMSRSRGRVESINGLLLDLMDVRGET